jgi:signal transduction histidine kinase
MVDATEGSGRQIATFGILMAINHPIYQVIWYFESTDEYQSFYLRAVAMLLSVSLIFHAYWPERLKKYLPFHWYFSLCFCLPFFFTYMTLKNHLSTLWLMNSMSALFFMFLVIDIISASILILIGFFLGIYFFSLNQVPLTIIPGTVSMAGLLATYAGAFVIGGIFARNNEIIRREKFEALHTLSASVAHEFRTPLAAIKFAMTGLSNYLPILVDSYKKAKAYPLEDIKTIRKKNLMLLENMPSGIDRLLYQANMSIDIMLMNARQLKISTLGFSKFNIKDCLEVALERYPFKSLEQRQLVHIDESLNAFCFYGKDILIIHVLFNLMKNALYFIEATQKGEIYIWTQKTRKANKLYFRDTSKGISKEMQKNLFKQFHSMREGGTGVGLSFCKMVMNALHGEINCYSELGVHTTFVLSFPRLKN